MAALPGEIEAEHLVGTYSDTILRLSLSWVNSLHDAQYICQTVLLKRLERQEGFPRLREPGPRAL